MSKDEKALQVIDSKAITKIDENASMETLISSVNLVKRVMKELLKKDEHYAIFTNKKGEKSYCLLKAGAEKLCTAFRLAPKYTISIDKLQNGHREYRIICELCHIHSGDLWGSGVGSCITTENNYSKVNWNPSNIYNTILKMAKKRALVDAVLTVTAASDIFTQDLEDITNDNRNNQYQVQPEQASGQAEKQEEKTTGNGGYQSIPKNTFGETERFKKWLNTTFALYKDEYFEKIYSDLKKEAENHDETFIQWFKRTGMNQVSDMVEILIDEIIQSEEK